MLGFKWAPVALGLQGVQHLLRAPVLKALTCVVICSMSNARDTCCMGNAQRACHKGSCLQGCEANQAVSAAGPTADLTTVPESVRQRLLPRACMCVLKQS